MLEASCRLEKLGHIEFAAMASQSSADASALQGLTDLRLQAERRTTLLRTVVGLTDATQGLKSAVCFVEMVHELIDLLLAGFNDLVEDVALFLQILVREG